MDSSSPVSIYERQLPRFISASDAIAYALHLAFLSNGFQLVGLDDDATSPDRIYEGLPGQWNANQDVYSFRYRHGSSLVIVKGLVVEISFFIHASRPGSDTIQSHEIVMWDHLVPATDFRNPEKIYSNLDELVSMIIDRIVKHFIPTERLVHRPSALPTPDDEDDDPLRLPRYPHGQPRGDFDDDLGPRPFDPFGSGRGGSYMGPDHPLFTRGRGRGRGRIPRFDPFGPDRGITGE
jgi:hypothetical protein